MISFLDHMRQSKFLPFAHRGASKIAPENTFAAFHKAYDLGFKIIETDVQSSRDGILYSFHDSCLKRLTGDRRRFGMLSSQEIDALWVEGGQRIPKLTDLYAAFPNAYFNLDAKSWLSVQPLVSLLKDVDIRNRTCVGSFSQARLDQILSGSQGLGCLHSLGTKSVVKLFANFAIGLPFTTNAACAQLPIRHFGLSLINAKTIKHFKSFGLKTYVWTINDPLEINHLIDIGVDGIMTDDCELLKLILVQRNMWVD